MTNKKFKVERRRKREIRTYKIMWDTSFSHLKRGMANREGSFYHFMSSIVFTAFALEAYLNHIGEGIFLLG